MGTTFRYFRHGSCPVCNGSRKDCRQSTHNELVFCRFTDANPNGWHFIGEDSNGFNMWAPGEGRDRGPRPKPAPAQVPTVEALPTVEMDRHWRRIIRTSGLSSHHRRQLHQRPHVTPSELEALTGLVFSWQGGEQFQLPPNFPGSDGRGALRQYPPNWAIAIPDIGGRIIGAQLKNPEGGYQWASSSSIDGAGPHLSNGELPLGIYGDRTPGGVAQLAEGYFKPSLTAARYGGAWIGAAGGNWAGCPQQLRAALDALRPHRVVLAPDGGAIANPHVMRQYAALRELLESWGYPLKVLWWGQSTKGAGDVDEITPEQFHQAEVVEWAQFTKAPDTQQARRDRTLQQARLIRQQARPLPHVATEGGYMAPLPPLPSGAGGAALSADMGAGKTQRIAHDLVGNGLFTLILQHRNGLGRQTSERCRVPHVHDYRETADGEKILGLDAQASGGISGCFNSIHRLRSHICGPYQVVVDEAMKTFTEAIDGGTIKDRYSEVVECLLDVLRGAEAVYIAEANLDRATVELVEGITGKPLQILHHKRPDTPWDVSLSSNLTAVRSQCAADLLAGKRALITATSLAELRYWEYFCRDHGLDADLPLCSETNDGETWTALFGNPDEYLDERRPQAFLFNQSAESGLSISGDHFDVIYGFGQGFPPSVLFQMLGRCRQPVPRRIYCPAYTPPSRWEKPQKASALAEMGLEVEAWAGRGFTPSTDSDQQLIDQYLAARRQQAWAEKVGAAEALQEMLNDAGHQVELVEWQGTPETAQRFREYKERLARDRSAHRAALEVDPGHHDPAWARKTLSSSNATHDDRCRAQKVLTLARFPGIDWDDSEVWYQAVFCPNHNATKNAPSRGPLAPGAALWAECDRAADILQTDTERAAVLLAARLRAAHLLPLHHQQVGCLAPFKSLTADLLEGGMIAPDDPRVRKLAAMARAQAADLHRYLRITATDEQSDVAIACKIARKFGLVVARHKCPRSNGTRQWSYTVAAPALWASLVEARKRAIEAVTDLLDPPISNFVTGISPGDLVRIGRGRVKALVEAVEGAIATLGDEFGRTFTATLATLTPAA